MQSTFNEIYTNIISENITSVNKFNDKLFKDTQRVFIDYINGGFEEDDSEIKIKEVEFNSDTFYEEWEVPKPMKIKLSDFIEYMGKGVPSEEEIVSDIKKIKPKSVFQGELNFEYLGYKDAAITIDKIQLKGDNVVVSFKNVELANKKDEDELMSDFGADIYERFN